jgi:hypothetical protein
MSNAIGGHPQATPAQETQTRYILTREEWDNRKRVYLEMWRLVCCSSGSESPDVAREAEIHKLQEEFVTNITNDPQTSEEFVRLAALHSWEWRKFRNQAKVEFTAFFVQLNKVYRVPLDEVIEKVYNNNAPPLLGKIWDKCQTPLASPNLELEFGVNQPAAASVPADRLPRNDQFSGCGATPYITINSNRVEDMLTSHPELLNTDTVTVYNHERKYMKISDVVDRTTLSSLGIE